MTSISPSSRLRSFCFVVTVPFLLAMLVPGCAEKIDTPQEYLELAYLHERNEKLPEAVAAYRKSLELQDKQPTAWYDLGVAFAAMDQFPEAIDAYSKAIDIDRNMARAFNNRAAAYARLKQFRSAIADCDRAIGLDPDDYLAWRNRGLAKHDDGQMESAISDYDESIRINGRSAESYHYRGNVFLDQKQWSRALEDFQQAVLLDGQMAAAHLSRSIALARLDRRDDAEAARLKAKELGSNVDDVIVADLLPDETVAEVAGDTHRQAVDFVQAAFSSQQRSVEPADAPWDLRTKSGEAEQRYVVRVMAEPGKAAGVSFLTTEIDLIRQPAIFTTLVIVQRVDPSKSDSQSPFRIVRTIERWTPDLSKMHPVTWSLPVSADSVDTKPAPVATAMP